MTRKLQHWFALSEKGAKDLVKAVFWCFVCNLALMFPIGVILFTAQHLLACMEHGGSSIRRAPTDGSVWRRPCASSPCPFLEIGT